MGRILRDVRVVRLAAIGIGTALSLLIVGAILSSLYVRGVDGPISNPTDFRAFYCGGAALAAGRDPYRVEPLRTCERASLAANGLKVDERHLLTAPFPPYALLAFSAQSRIPFRLATEFWLALNIVALGFGIIGVSRLSRLRPTVVALTMLASAGYASLAIGQLVPLVLTALIYAALCARRGNGVGAAICLAVASLEPHLALPAWCAIALFVPRCRVPVAGVAIALCVVSLTAGTNLNVEYLTQVLPQHARSEVYNFPAQYSLSALLAVAGVPVVIALRLATLSYACALVAGLCLGRQLQRRFDDPAFAIVTPAAAVLLGGPFVHIHQMAAAMPFALMLLARVSIRKPAGIVVLAAVCALAVPWESIAEMPVLADHLPQKAIVRTLPVLSPMIANEPVERPYTAFIDAFGQRNDARTILEQLLTKLPTWYALIALLCSAAIVVVRPTRSRNSDRDRRAAKQHMPQPAPRSA